MSPQPKPKDSRYPCGMCGTKGTVPDPIPGDPRNEKACPQCGGDGWL